MKIRNPQFARPDHAKMSAVQTFLTGLDGSAEFVTFSDVRAGVVALAAEPDGVIHQIFIDLGHKVLRDE
jgi:hypothetical protein